MEKKTSNQRPKNSQCPTCGKYLSNDVVAMRKKLDEQATFIDNMSLQMNDLQEKVNELKKVHEQVKQQLAKEKEKVRTRDIRIQELAAEINRLKTRNLWQRIWNI